MAHRLSEKLCVFLDEATKRTTTAINLLLFFNIEISLEFGHWAFAFFTTTERCWNRWPLSTKLPSVPSASGSDCWPWGHASFFWVILLFSVHSKFIHWWYMADYRPVSKLSALNASPYLNKYIFFVFSFFIQFMWEDCWDLIFQFEQLLVFAVFICRNVFPFLLRTIVWINLS